MTTAINLAAELTRRGKSVVVIDAVPARLPSSIATDKRLPYKVITALCEAVGDVGGWAKSVRAIKADFIIVDAPGAMGAAFGASFPVADLVLIPSGATVLDVRGAIETVKAVRQHRKASGKGKPDMLIVPARITNALFPGRRSSRRW